MANNSHAAKTTSENHPDLPDDFHPNPNHQTPKTMDFKDHLISIAIALVVVAYVVSPVDIVPDVIVPFGTVDDGIIVLLGYLREILSKRNG